MNQRTNCPNCGSSEIYRSTKPVHPTPSLGLAAFPAWGSGMFYAVACSDCGLTQLFASTIDARSLRSSRDWVRGVETGRPLGLEG